MDKLAKWCLVSIIFMCFSFGINLWRLPTDFRNGAYSRLDDIMTMIQRSNYDMYDKIISEKRNVLKEVQSNSKRIHNIEKIIKNIWRMTKESEAQE